MKDLFHVTKGWLVAAIVALLVLTALSWGLAHLPLGAWETVVALGIATVKATVIGLLFMELAEVRGTMRFVALTAPAWIAILIAFMLADVWAR